MVRVLDGRRGKATVIAKVIGLQSLIVLPGLAWGCLAYRAWWGWDNWLGPGAISTLLLALSAFGPSRGNAGGVAAALSCYTVLIMRAEVFVEIDDWPGLFLGIGAILAPLLCLKLLIRSRAWLAVCGIVLFSVTSLACLSFNVLACGSGRQSGFFQAYRYNVVR